VAGRKKTVSTYEASFLEVEKEWDGRLTFSFRVADSNHTVRVRTPMFVLYGLAIKSRKALKEARGDLDMIDEAMKGTP
jgi:hypothetical protein